MSSEMTMKDVLTEPINPNKEYLLTTKTDLNNGTNLIKSKL